MVGGVALQDGPFGGEIGQAEGPRTDGALVEGGIVELARAQARQKVRGQDADRGVGQERRERLGERDLHRQVVDLDGREAAEEVGQGGLAAVVGVLNGLDGEDDVVGGERFAVMPG